MKIETKIKKFYEKGFMYAIDSARGLLKIAEIAANENEFGIACSLNVLAAEEAIKAQYINSKINNPINEIADFKRVFKDHSHKHKQLTILINQQPIVKSLFKDIHFELNNLMKDIETMPSGLQENVHAKFPLIKKNFEFVKRIYEEKYEILKINKWLKDANKNKNKGLYLNLDFEKNKWERNRFNRLIFERERKYTNQIIEIVIDSHNLTYLMKEMSRDRAILKKLI
ncbi:MAG TPA: AbiV family abortive infection protein [Puia sp.]